MKKKLFVAALVAACIAPVFISTQSQQQTPAVVADYAKVSIDDYPATAAEELQIKTAIDRAARESEKTPTDWASLINPATYNDCNKQLAQNPTYWMKGLCEKIGQELQAKAKGV